jgi:hypothetical protein
VTQNCTLKGSKKDWHGLPKDKSLFGNAKGVGVNRSCIFNRPFECVVECYFNGVTHSGFERTKKDWHGLPKDKSLFGNAKGVGLPIGNLTINDSPD